MSDARNTVRWNWDDVDPDKSFYKEEPRRVTPFERKVIEQMERKRTYVAGMSNSAISVENPHRATYINNDSLTGDETIMKRGFLISFIKHLGLDAWHIRNDLVEHPKWTWSNDNHNPLTLDGIQITWDEMDIGHGYGGDVPKIKGAVGIIENSPGYKHYKPFDMYCHKVVQTDNNKTMLSFVEKKTVIFNVVNNRYELYKKPSKLELIKNLIKKIKN